MAEITEWVLQLGDGDPAALNELIPLLYEELRKLANQRRWDERSNHTLTSTALVHETYLRLLKQRKVQAKDRLEFLAIASVTMRRILVDYARTRTRKKRGGGEAAVSLSEAEPFLSLNESIELQELSAALERLEERSPRAAHVVQLRFFGGLSVEDIAEYLGLTVRTIHRDWVAARAWLRQEVGSFHKGLAGEEMSTTTGESECES